MSLNSSVFQLNSGSVQFLQRFREYNIRKMKRIVKAQTSSVICNHVHQSLTTETFILEIT